MQSISFVGKMYGKKATGSGDKMRLNFRLAVRKQYVSEDDKKNNKVNVFVPFVAFGKLAELLDQYIEDGQGVALHNCEYTTFEWEDDGETQYGHNFKAGGMSFLPTSGDEDGGGSSRKSSGSKKRRSRDDDDEEEEERSSRKSRRSSSSGKSSGSKKPKKPVYDDEDEEDDDVPF